MTRVYEDDYFYMLFQKPCYLENDGVQTSSNDHSDKIPWQVKYPRLLSTNMHYKNSVTFPKAVLSSQFIKILDIVLMLVQLLQLFNI